MKAPLFLFVEPKSYCMKRNLLFVSLTIFLFLFARAVNGQGNQVITNGDTTKPIIFPATQCFYNWTLKSNNNFVNWGTGNIPPLKLINNTRHPIVDTLVAIPAAIGYAYVTNYTFNDVYAVNLTTNNDVTIPITGGSPYGVAVSKDNKRVYVTDQFTAVHVIDATTNKAITSIPVGASFGVCVSNDNKRVYVTGGNHVSVINAETDTVITSIPTKSPAFGICVNSDGSRVYVTSPDSNRVSVINTLTNKLISIIPIPSNSTNVQQRYSTPRGITISPDGSRLYVSNFGNNTVSVINTANNIIVSTIQTGGGPFGIAITPDGSKVYVTNHYSDDVSVIDTKTNSVTSTVPVGTLPIGIAVSPDGGQFVVMNNNDPGSPNYNSDNEETFTAVSTATNKETGSFDYSTSINASPNTFDPISFGNFISGYPTRNGSTIMLTITINPTIALPADNFKLAITSASCKETSNGMVQIDAAQKLDYTATITGNGRNDAHAFTNSAEIDSLAAGTYHLCITIAGQPAYSQCYDVVITAPKDLFVYSAIDEVNKSIKLSLRGGAQYNIQLNSNTYTTADSSITLPLNVGNNSLTVTTNKQCQGMVQKQINISGEIGPYPVPFQNTLNVNIGNDVVNSALIEIHNVTDGKLVYAKTFAGQSGVLQLDVSALSSGIYALHLSINSSEKVFKITKK